LWKSRASPNGESVHWKRRGGTGKNRSYPEMLPYGKDLHRGLCKGKGNAEGGVSKKRGKSKMRSTLAKETFTKGGQQTSALQGGHKITGKFQFRRGSCRHKI